MVTGYCVHEKTKNNTFKDEPEYVEMMTKKGKKAFFKGSCSSCGKSMSVLTKVRS